MDNDLYFKLWIEFQREKIKEWRRSKSKKKFVGERGYLHFDGKLSFHYHIDSNNHKICEVMKNATVVASHSFLPFIRDDQRVRRYRNKGEFDQFGEIRKHSNRYSTIKNRPIMYASHRDACIYSMYGFMLSEKYERLLEEQNLTENILAYRRIPNGDTGRNKSNIDFARDVFGIIQASDEVGMIMIDVSHFFDGLSHKKLAEKWTRIMKFESFPPDHAIVFKTLTSFRYVFKDQVYKALKLDSKKLEALSKKKRNNALCSPSDFNKWVKKGCLIHSNRSGAGIPQGSPISGLLANVYMIDFDTKMRYFVEKVNDGIYRRYSDDVVILIKKEMLAEAYEYAKILIKDESLTIKDTKTEAFVFNKKTMKYNNALDLIIDPDKNPDYKSNYKEYPQYLGFTFGGNELIIRSSTLSRRFRGKHRLDKNRWNYFRLAERKTRSASMRKQVASVRRKIKKVTTEIQKPGKNVAGKKIKKK